jgi:hypothetical protein
MVENGRQNLNKVEVLTWCQSNASSSGYGGGEVGQSQFDDQAKNALENYSKNFGDFNVANQEESKVNGEDSDKKERARRANKIYRKVCQSAGQTSCFFNNFGTWSDFVSGKMSESEFHDHAETAMRQMIAESGQ